MKYALLGEKLGHSYSALIHKNCGLDYSLLELKKEDLLPTLKKDAYNGFNVTIPYKKTVIDCLDEIDDSAKSVGAVNTIKKQGGKLIGFNTDVYGMDYAIKRRGVSLNGKTVLILGSGGTSLTAAAVCKNSNAKFVVVSRTGEVNYSNCYDIDAEIIIDTTPIGTYPNVYEKIIDISRFKRLEFVLDCVYNPFLTEILKDAKALNINFSNGLPMLVAQAIKAQEIFLDKKIDSSVIEENISYISRDRGNIVLSGMPSSGKSTIGKLIATKLNRELIDTDEVITKKTGKTPKEIIIESGEKVFREIESEVIKQVSIFSGKVIALGGGAVLNKDNVRALKTNGVIVYIKRDLNALSTKDRPLSMGRDIKELFKERQPFYESASDITVENVEIEKTMAEIIKKYEDFSDKRC